MRNIVVMALTCLVCLPATATADTIKTSGVERDIQSQFFFQKPCVNPTTGETGVSTYAVTANYFEVPDSLNSTVLKGDIGLSIDIFIPCLLEAHSIQSFHDDPIYPNYSAQINGVINPNLKAGKLYVDVPMFDNTTNCVYQGTLSLNIEAISNPNNLGVTDKTYINERNKIIYHGIIRESQAKATGQLTLKTLSCYPGGEISNPLDNYIPFPSTSANLREIKYSEITITKK